MGWFDGLWTTTRNEPNRYAKLDPELRKFLENDSSSKGATSTHDDLTSSATPGSQAGTTPDSEGLRTTGLTNETPAPVPTQSLYQDGRYAHLWSTYRSQAEVEWEQKSEEEKVSDVLGAFKERKSTIQRDAMENCAVEQSEYSECMRSGSWKAKMSMCSEELRHFERCFTTQARLLKALGYLSVAGRSPEVEEDIRMHADALYQRMAIQEAAVEKAKAEGKAIPTFAPVIPASPLSSAAQAEQPASGTERVAQADTGSDDILSKLNTRGQAKRQKVLANLSEADRATEDAALRTEFRVAAETAAEVKRLQAESRRARQERLARGEGTLTDSLMSLFVTGK